MVTTATIASAAPTIAVSVEAAAARSVGPTKSDQFGWGGLGVIAPELVLTRAISVELAVGALALQAGGGAPPDGVTPTSYGFAGFATVGPRFRPLSFLDGDGAFEPGGLWFTGGLGAGVTGEATRPAVRAALGFDISTSGIEIGPFAGFFQLVEPDDGSLRPEDARVGLFGLHGSFGRAAVPPVAGDGDRVSLSSDACSGSSNRAPGCPDAVRDADGDGIADGRDACPAVPEDRDGHEDSDGCPEEAVVLAADIDRDGIPDAVDSCPEDIETVNQLRDDDGCPDAADLDVDGSAIIVGEHLHFPSGGTVMDAQGARVVASLTAFLSAHPEYRRMRVEGHADDIGPEAFNLALSRKRADEVIRRLVAGGIDPSRLHSEARGEAMPIDTSLTSAARRTNRRVQLIIEERAPSPATTAATSTATTTATTTARMP